CSLRNISRHDACRVAGCMQRLNSAPGSQIQNTPDDVAHCHLRESERCTASTQNMLPLERTARGQLTKVRRQPPTQLALCVRRGVRAQTHSWPQFAVPGYKPQLN